MDNRRKHATQLPAELADIKRVDSINILGVTLTNTLTVNEHVDRVLSNCAQSVFALLRAHNVFNAAILTKLTYGVRAWIGFTCFRERERTEALTRRYKFSELCSVKTKTFAEICDISTIIFSAISHVTRIISSTTSVSLRSCRKLQSQTMQIQ